MYLVRAPCKKTDRSVAMYLDKYEYIIIIITTIVGESADAEVQNVVYRYMYMYMYLFCCTT